MQKILLYTIVLFCLSHCASDPELSEEATPDHTTIKVELDTGSDLDSFPISSLVETYSHLKATSDDHILGKIGKIMAYQGHYYLLDTKPWRMFIFGKDGSLKYGSKKGKGPGEMMTPADFCIDRYNQKLIIMDISTGNVLEYDLSGRFLSSKRMDPFFPNIIPVDSSHFYIVNRDWRRNNKGFLLSVGPSFEKIDNQYLNPQIDFYSSFTAPVFSAFEDEQYFSLAFNSKIYQLFPDSIQLRYEVDFGEDNLTEKEKMLDRFSMLEVMIQRSRASQIWPFIKLTDDLIYFTFTRGRDDRYHYFYSNSKGSGLCIKELVINGYKVRIGGYDDDNNLVGIIDQNPRSWKAANSKVVSFQKENFGAADLPNIDFSLSNPVVVSISSQELEKELFK